MTNSLTWCFGFSLQCEMGQFCQKYHFSFLRSGCSKYYIGSLAKSSLEDLSSLTKLIVVIFFAEKLLEAFALHCKSFSHFFSAKNGTVFTFNTLENFMSR